MCFDMHVDNEWWFLDFIIRVLNVLLATFIFTIVIIIVMTFRLIWVWYFLTIYEYTVWFYINSTYPTIIKTIIIIISNIQHIFLFRSSQNEWVQSQSSHGTFSWNQQNNQYPEASTSHYPYNYPSNNHRGQQHYSNTYNFQQQQGEGARYSYQQSYYSYGYHCPNGDSRSSGASFATNNGNHQASCHNIKDARREHENNSNEKRKVGTPFSKNQSNRL